MAVLNNKELRQSFSYLSTIENILLKEQKLVSGNKSHIDKIVPEILINEYSKKLDTALDFIDSVVKISYDISLVALVASFEKIVFAKYKTAFGSIKTVVKEKAEKPLDYFLMREKFVYGSIDKLHSIIELIDGHIDQDLIKKLKIIKEQRDYIAHGKRFGSLPVFDMTLQQIAQCLDEIIIEIEK